MDTRTVEQVNQWESRPLTGGLAGLRRLADEGFSGAVRAAGTWAFVLNGRVVGVFEGDLEDFEGQDGTAYQAPDQALALLFTMRELGGKTQAKYYTNDTPLSEVHETLSSASFSGYVELSENVLSGDYYVVYYGGRSMSAAFVGESERLLTGDEAFDRADDEIGIYEVKKVDIDVIDLSEVVDDPEPEPEPEVEPEPEADPKPEPEAETESEPEPSQEQADAPGEPPENAHQEVETAPQESENPPQKSTADDQGAKRQDASREVQPREEQSQEEQPRDEPTIAESSEPTEPATSPKDDSNSSTDAPSSPKAEPSSSVSDETGSSTTKSSSGTQQDESSSDDVFNEEEQWRQARAIPSLDPERSSDQASGGQKSKHRPKSASKESTSTERTPSKNRSAETRKSSTSDRSKNASEPKSGQETTDDSKKVSELERALKQSKQEIDRLSAQLSETEAENQELLAEREELRAEVERLTSELESAKANDGATGAPAGRSLSVEDALEGTNLFVRYASKSQLTLEDARDGADQEEVNTNLSLEHHTQFDADEVVVDGTEFETFLRGSIQYRFVEWIVEELVYEIRDTGHVAQLRELYEAIPKIDRAELIGNATIRKTENGEEVRTQRTFDVILRDRMGNPLVVANLNDDRDPATGDMMADLVSAANDVGETSSSLSAATFVTASFFEPQALETAAEATGGGLLSREKKESYVKLTRKRGYHLCLVETRGGQFHVNVPEL